MQKGPPPEIRLFIQKNSALVQNANTLWVFNITDPANITLQGSFSPTGRKKNTLVQDLFYAPRENMVLVLTSKSGSDEFEAKIINYSNMSSIIYTPVLSLSDDDSDAQAYFLPRRKLLLFFTESLIVYNISDPTAPKFISSQQLAPFEDLVAFLPVTFSIDEKTAFVVIIDRSELAHLYSIDVSDLENMKILSVLELPKIVQDSGKQPLILSRDMKRGFLITDRNILVINFKNLSSPAILGMISLGIISDQEVSKFFLSSDEKVGYLSGPKGQFLQVGLEFPYALYLQQEKFFLGKKY